MSEITDLQGNEVHSTSLNYQLHLPENYQHNNLQKAQ